MTTVLCFALVACGGKQPTTPGTGSSATVDAGPVKDTRTELEKRLAGACLAAGTKVTQCAVDDAKKEVEAGRMSEKDFKLNTEAKILEKNTEDFVKKCDNPTTSSRQVRVLEVCHKEETACEPFLDCLSHLDDKPVK